MYAATSMVTKVYTSVFVRNFDANSFVVMRVLFALFDSIVDAYLIINKSILITATDI